MFVATTFGLFMPALRPDWAQLPEDAPELQVRARRRVDLDRLRKYMLGHGLVLGPTIALPNTDYQFRAYCSRVAWGMALSQLALDIDYTKFKDTPEKYHRDRKLTEAYGRVWTAVLNAFPAGSVYGAPARGRKGKGGSGPKAQTLFSDRQNWWEDI